MVRQHWVCYVLRSYDGSGKEYVGIEPEGKARRIEQHREANQFLGSGNHVVVEEATRRVFGTIYQAVLLEQEVLIARMRAVGVQQVRGGGFPAKEIWPREIQECEALTRLPEQDLRNLLQQLQREGVAGASKLNDRFRETRSHCLLQCWDCKKRRSGVPLADSFGHMKRSDECPLMQKRQRNDDEAAAERKRREEEHLEKKVFLKSVWPEIMKEEQDARKKRRLEAEQKREAKKMRKEEEKQEAERKKEEAEQLRQRLEKLRLETSLQLIKEQLGKGKDKEKEEAGAKASSRSEGGGGGEGDAEPQGRVEAKTTKKATKKATSGKRSHHWLADGETKYEVYNKGEGRQKARANQQKKREKESAERATRKTKKTRNAKAGMKKAIATARKKAEKNAQEKAGASQ